MAVKYEISSDVATITGVASNTQLASIVKFYTGSITYDDEPTSKYASVTINGKTQRVMLCVAVSGTASYDDVPCLYSTVSGHRTLNVVEPTESGTPDDVPSLYETVVVDGKTVRALRCVLINKTPNYDGVSSTCTFTDNGKTHTAQLVNKIVGGSIEVIVKGTSPLSLPDAIADSLSYVKAFGGTEQRNLPDNYIERQFIYMMDGSYLLTDIVPQSDNKIELDFQTTSMPATGGSFVGSRDTASAGAGIQLGFNSSTNFTIDGMGSRYTSTNTIANNTRYKFIWNNGLATIETGGSVVDTNTFTPSGTNTYPLVINGLNNAGTPGGGQAGIYLYSFKMWNRQGELVMNLVPAVQRGTVPVVGFYDTVSKTFKTATVGTFAAGGEAVPTPDTPIDIVSNNGVLKARHQSGLPLGYTELEYIQSTGTQYIDTGIIPNGSTKVEMVAQANYSSDLRFFGAVAGSETPLYFAAGYSVSGKWNNMYNSTNNVVSNDVTGFLADKLEHKIVKDNVLSVDGNVLNTISVASFELPVSMYLFTVNDNENPGVLRPMLIKYAKIWNNNTLVRDFIPAKNSSGVIGMYDLVSGQFFTNAGSGTFTAGDPVSDPVEIYTDGTVETIWAHGKNLFGDYETLENTYIDASGNYNSNNSINTYRYFKVSPSTVYTISGKTTANGALRIAEYTSNKTFVVRNAYVPASGTDPNPKITITTTATTEYLAMSIDKDVYDIQFEQGSTATDYEPYFNGGTATAEMLLKVGDYQDVQSIIDGVVTRKVGVKVFNGTENWLLGSSTSRFTLADAFNNLAQIFNNYVGYSNCYTIIATSVSIQSRLQNNQCGWNTTQVFCLRDDRFTTVEQFKQYLADQYAAGTPVIIVYPLAEPTTESVAGQTLQVQDGDNTLEITQASLDNLELECKYSKNA